MRNETAMKHIAAFFDVDGTISDTTVVHALIKFKLREAGWRKWLWLCKLPMRLLWWALIDLASREAFNRSFYASYSNIHVDELSSFASEYFESFWVRRLYLEAIERIEWHRRNGHRIVILTGGINLLVKPLADFLKVDDVIAAELEVHSGRFTGRLNTPPLGGSGKLKVLQNYADSSGVELSMSYAYADSYSDRFVLERVGHPVAVNPDLRLKLLANRRGWRIERWKTKLR
ncbi:MAG: HAD family hydrolase [Armatimonadota bacterium]|nr:HAD-IB family hydrolase [Armatimonadota bacterium]MCX7777229.1 HAD-IB family hydrolase [Armatimonadota bacterium]MDW8024644.1 HAD family hydrolase [Armatimonadota bacterium]